MKIAFVLSRDPMTSGGGVRKYVYNISLQLLRNRIETIIISPKETKRSFFKYIPIKSNLNKNIDFFIKLFIKTPFISLPQDAIILGQRADFLFPFLIFKKGGKKGIYVHGQQYKGVQEKGKLFYNIFSKIEGYSIKKADFLIFTDKETENEYKKRYNNLMLNKFTTIIPVGVDIKLFKLMNQKYCRKKLKLPLNKKIIILVGRLNQEKRIDLAIKAFRKISKESKDIILVIIGEGPKREYLKSLASKLKLSDKIIFIGEIDNRNIPYYLNAADIFLLSSDREGSPLVLKEAIACGLPVIATNVGDVNEIINDRIGIIIPINNSKIIAESIVIALNKKWNSDYIQKYARQFTWENIAKKLITYVMKIQETPPGKF